ncbi:NADPH-dependent glutamate synthase [Sulfurospirillum sp. T05]|uniref:NADPH-dependent glutamate synthase n=1 Tax=Sulfurospirillum tamanense TaxID=2813362 RepID=A0ABS2WUE3_9BACT|nr:NADPH-dependent glutamate synthase [Sulfurospirillum tamanensis]MBN2964809.1 NADPH-dependent glutamate synthase [Sulfurospirillum tamanensis]
MYEIMQKKLLAPGIVSMDIYAPLLAASAKPGQFLIVKMDEFGERIPLTVCDEDKEKGTITIVFMAIGKSTQVMAQMEVGDAFSDVVGPLGRMSEFIQMDKAQLAKERVVFVAGGVGTAPVYPQVKWFVDQGLEVDVIIGARSRELVILEEAFRALTPNVHVCTDDGTYGFNGNVTQLLEHLMANEHKPFTHMVAIGPMIMMKFATLMAKKLGLDATVSMNPLMVDGTGMCGACRVMIDGKVKFACVDGPEFDGHKVDFDEAQRRLCLKAQEKLPSCEEENPNCPTHQESQKEPKRKVHPKMADAAWRVGNFAEVNLGYTMEEAIIEANRCLDCKTPSCVLSCPVGVDIPGFIRKLKTGDMQGAAQLLAQHTKLPSVCGRVCPQEKQCEMVCVTGIKKDPVSIGLLERFVGDWALENLVVAPVEKNGKKVAVVGSGPAGLAAAAELASLGYGVEVFESLHKLGGVLAYGIPSFRLPKEIVAGEIGRIESLGVLFHTNVVVGKTLDVDTLLAGDFDAVFIGSGAGFPRFMGIKGENALGVLSANEFLTRVNLMRGHEEGYQTPTTIGQKVVVVGAGNVSMDAARVAKRLGAVTCVVYRRSEAEIPARAEEVEHAKEEGVAFHLLTNPVEILSDESGHVCGVKCVQMTLGEPDADGRRSPRALEGSEFVLEADTVIMSIGTMPNDLVTASTKGLEVGRQGTILVRENSTQTSRKGVFAGGDIVTGAATVIEAMGAGKQAAMEIDKYIRGL